MNRLILVAVLFLSGCTRLDSISYQELMSQCTNNASESCIQDVSTYVHDNFRFKPNGDGYCEQYAEDVKSVLFALDLPFEQLYCNLNRMNEPGHTVIESSGFVIDNKQWRFVYPVSDIPYNCESL